MIVINLDKARAIAEKHAKRIEDDAERAECIQAIAKADIADELAAIVRLIAISSEDKPA